MAKFSVRGVAFDMYGTVVDVGAVAEACKAIAPDPVAFNIQWRAKQLEYSFLLSAMGKYQDFWNRRPGFWRMLEMTPSACWSQ